MASVLRAEGIETEIFQTGARPVQDCVACRKCVQPGKCVFDDAVNERAEKAKKADAVFDVEDFAAGMIRFENGACLQIEFSWASNIAVENRFVELRGTKAGFTVRDSQMEIYTEDHGSLLNIVPPANQKDDGHGRNLKNFLDVVLDGAEPCFLPQQGVDMIKILQAFYESAALGREVQL